MHDVDVIIPAYNAEQSIAATIQSVLEQTAPAKGIVVVDDGSTDGTVAAAKQFGDAVKVVSKPNGGQGSARAWGAGITYSEFTLFLDADDLLLPTAIQRLRDHLMQHEDAPLVYCRAELLFDAGAGQSELDYALHDAEGDVWCQLVERNFIRTPGCVLMRRSALEAAGGWDGDDKYRGHEDWDLWIRLAAIGPLTRLNDQLLKYRIHVSNFSAKRNRMDRSELFVIYKQSRIRQIDPKRQATIQARFRAVRGVLAGVMVREASSRFGSGHWVEAFTLVAKAIGIWPRCLIWPVKRLFGGGGHIAGPR